MCSAPRTAWAYALCIAGYSCPSGSSPKPPQHHHILISAGVTSRAPMGTSPSRSSTYNSGREDFCDFCLFSSSTCYILQQQPVVYNNLLLHLCRSLGRHWGMLMDQGGNEARPVLGSYQGPMGKEQDQEECGSWKLSTTCSLCLCVRWKIPSYTGIN